MPANSAHFWDRAARKYAASPISDVQGYERTLEAVRQALRPSDVVIEFGCGTGATALRLAPSAARLVATDISEMIAIARERLQKEAVGNVEFAVAGPDAVSWPDASFDAALAFNLLHLVEARAAALASINRLLKPGGLFISKTPCVGEMNPLIRLAIPVMQAFGKAPYVSVFSAGALEREIEAAGFAIVERARHGARGNDARIYLAARKA